MTNVRKAAKAAVVAVYDENGKLVGTVDPKAIAPVGSASASTADTKDKSAAANAPDDATAAIAKALAGARFNTDASGSTVAVLKGAADLDDQFERLIKSLDRAAAGRVQDAVASVALRMVGARRVSTTSAVRLAKRAAVEASFSAARKAEPH